MLPYEKERGFVPGVPADPDLMRLQAELADLSKKMDAVWKELNEKFPVAKNYSWGLYGDGRIHVSRLVNMDGSEIEEDNG